MEKITILIVLLILLTGCNEVQEIKIEELTAEEIFQMMEQSNSELNKFNVDLKLNYVMIKIHNNETTESRSTIESISQYDKISKQSYTRGSITTNGNIETTEIETKGDLSTKKLNGIIVETTKGDSWENVTIPGPSLDPYYIPMGEDFQRLGDEIVGGTDCYAIVMEQNITKILESILTTTSPYHEIPEADGEAYVKIWIDKKDFHMVKSISFLNITTDKFTWFIDGEILISDSPGKSYITTSDPTISTDKNNYNKGEIIKIFVKNGLDEPILYSGGGDRFWGIENYKNDEWINAAYEESGGFQLTDENIGDNCYILLYERTAPSELSPNSLVSSEWNQKICPFGRGGPTEAKTVRYIESGTYRLVFNYGLELSVDDPYRISDFKKIYSNTFVVK